MSSPHEITTRPSARRVVIEHDGVVLADTTRAIELDEPPLPTRYYVPREDVTVELEPSDTTTHCPFKGDATYVSAAGVKDAFWVYEAPDKAAAEPVTGMLAPWPGRVTVKVDGEPVS